MKWTKYHPRLWIPAAVWLGLTALLTVIPDTGLWSCAVDYMQTSHGINEKLVQLGLFAAGILVQFGLNRLPKVQKAAWIPLILGFAVLILAEGFWFLASGWDRLLTLLLYFFCLPPALGAMLEILTETILNLSPARKTAALASVCLIVGVGICLYPAYAWERLTYDPDPQMYFVWPAYTTNHTGGTSEHHNRQEEWYMVESMDELADDLKWMKITPDITAPALDGNRCYLLRLNEKYVLMAPCNSNTAYIYRYEGPLNAFDGKSCRYRVITRTPYDELNGNLIRETE
ncbi:MAG: hypothetical protein IJ480_06490 [Clostridia bacterium]|nr:hypothetical protein [Clostridia bacterium]